MGFVTELVGSMIRSNMENPEHRDAHFKSHMAGKYIEANKL